MLVFYYVNFVAQTNGELSGGSWREGEESKKNPIILDCFTRLVACGGCEGLASWSKSHIPGFSLNMLSVLV